MEFSPNPAKRLLELTNNALNKAPNQNSDKQAIEVWANIFDIQIEDEFEIIKRLFECHKLIDEIQELLQTHEKTNNDLYLSCLPYIRQIFPIGKIYNSFWSLRQNVQPIHIKSLEFCVHAIDSFYSEKVIDSKELDKIIEEIKKLYNQIKKSDLESKLKNLLLDLLKTIENSIHEYEIRGIEKIDETGAYLIGKLIVNKDLLKRNEENKSVISFKKIVGKFISIWAFSSDSFGNLEGLSKHIPLLPEYIEKVKEIGQNLLK